MQKKILTLLIVFGLMPPPLAAMPYLDIANLYLLNMPSEPETSSSAAEDHFTVKSLSKREAQFLAFKILSELYDGNELKNEIIDTRTLENLEVYEGANLLDNINKTSTYLGKAYLAGILSNPTAHLKELHRRQRITRALFETPVAITQFKNALTTIHTIEPWLLTFWQEEHPLFEQTIKRFYVADFLPGSSLLNTSPANLELLRRAEDFGTLLLIPFALLYIRHLFKNGTYDHFKNTVNNPPQNFIDLWLGLVYGGSELAFALLVNIPLTTYQMIQYYSLMYKTMSYLHQKLSYLAIALSKIKEIHRLLLTHKNILAEFHECKALQDLFGKANALNTEVYDLTRLLSSDTFKRPFSYTISFGRILAAQKLVQRVKNDFLPALGVLAQLDAFISSAQLLQESKHNKIRFCFAHYAVQEKPHIEMNDFWNPLISSQQVICNSLEMGLGQANNIILTGQNTGGKSTILKAIAINILLAQTIGICAGNKTVITPFNYIATYMNITDNVKERESLFAAEVKRAKQLREKIASLTSNQKSFSIIDEAFKGTGGEAENLSYWYAQQLASYPYSMSIHATHYPKLTKLEQETKGLYYNYKVEVGVNPDGTLNRSYLLERGYTLHNIAEHILVEQGLKN